MSESCTVVVTNNSGRSLDAVAIWYAPDGGVPDDMSAIPPTVTASNLPDGASIRGTTPIVSFSPVDYWIGSVLFEGDGTSYVLCGIDGETGKEFEVSDGSTITFVINAYTAGTTNQKNDVTIQYSEGSDGSAQLLHEGVGRLADFTAGALRELAEHTVGEVLAA